MGISVSKSLSTGSQSVVWIPKTLSVFSKVNYFPKILKMLLLFKNSHSLMSAQQFFRGYMAWWWSHSNNNGMYVSIFSCFLEFSKVAFQRWICAFLEISSVFSQCFLLHFYDASLILPAIISVTSLSSNKSLFWNPQVFPHLWKHMKNK